MLKIKLISLALIAAVLLAGCNLPIAASPTPVSESATLTPSPSATTVTIVPTNTLPPASPVPPTETISAPTSTSIPSQPVTIDQIRMLTASDGWGWASTNGEMTQLLRTMDGGVSWTNASPQENYTYYGSFFLDSNLAWLPYYDSATSKGGILRTSDGGKTWESLPNSENLQNAWFEFKSANDGLAETAGMGAGNAYLNYYKTADGGLTWSVVDLVPPKTEEGLPPGTVHLCNICGDNLYFDGVRTIIIYGDMASEPTGKVRIAVSSNLGKDWKNLELALPEKYRTGQVAPISPTFFDSDGILPINVVQYNPDGTTGFSILLLYATHDGGLTWQELPGVVDGVSWQAANVQVLTMNNILTRCGANLCASSDGAKSWQILPGKLNFDLNGGAADGVTQFDFADPSNGWAITGQSGASILWNTTDGGQSWKKVAPHLLP